MSVNVVSTSGAVPAAAPVAKAQPGTPAATALQTAADPKAKAASVSGVAATALQEATETRTQTVKEAAHGDRQAQRQLDKQATAQRHQAGRIINTKA